MADDGIELTGEQWKALRKQLAYGNPIAFSLTGMDLDQHVNVVLRSGVQIEGYIGETDHPFTLRLYHQYPPKWQLVGDTSISVGDVAAFTTLPDKRPGD